MPIYAEVRNAYSIVFKTDLMRLNLNNRPFFSDNFSLLYSNSINSVD